MSQPFATREPLAALRRPQPVRRRRRGRALPVLLSAFVKATLLVGAPAAVGVWLATSPYFLVREVGVRAGERVPQEWVAESLSPLIGRHILAVSLAGVRARLAGHPWVAAVELRKELPARLAVEVVERRPVALLETPAGASYLDPRGAVIGPCPDPAAEGLLMVRHAGGGPVPVAAVAALVEELERAHAAWAAGLWRVEVLGEGEYRLDTRALPFPVLVRAGGVAAGVARLERVLAQVRQREAGSVDLRIPRRVVVGPAADGSATAGNEGRQPTEG